MAHEDDDDLWTELYGEAAPAEEQRPAVSRSDPTLDEPPQAAPLQPVGDTSRQQVRTDGAHSAEGQGIVQFSEPAAVEGQGAEGEEDDDDDGLDIQLDASEAAEQEQGGSEDDDEFDITLDADEDPGVSDNQQVADAANMYVRPGADTPQAQLSASTDTAPLQKAGGTATGTASAEPASMVPGMVVAPAATSSALVPGPPRQPAGPPPVWPHTLQRYVPPQGLGVDEPVLPSLGKPGQRIRLPGQTRVMYDEYKEFLALGHGEIFNLDPDLVMDAPWRHPGADVSAFFNYDHTMRTWRDYCKHVEQYRLQFTMQKKIQTLDASSPADPAIDPDLPPELRAALAAERRQQPAPPLRRPLSALGGPRGPRPPPRQVESNAVVLAGGGSQQANGTPDDQGRLGSGPRVANGQGIKIRLHSGEMKADTRKPQENGLKGPPPPPPSGPKPPPGRPPPRPPAVPPPRPPSGPPPGPRPPPRPPPGPGFDGPGMMGMGGMPMGFGPIGPMGPMGPMGMMGGPMGMDVPGMGGPMMGMGMPGGPMMGGPMMGGPMMGGPMGGPHPPMPPLMMGMNPDMAMMGKGQGWGRSRRDNLAELGITEEEFKEYASKKPPVDPDVGAGSLAMGMDVDPASQQPSSSQSRPNGSSFAELAGYRGRRRGDSGSDDDRDRHRDRLKDIGRDRYRSSRRSRSRSRDRDSKRSRHADDRGDSSRRRRL